MHIQNARITVLLVFASALLTAATASCLGGKTMVVCIALLVHVALEGAIAIASLSQVPDEVALGESERIEHVCHDYGLSSREREVVEAYASCRDIRCCANELFISPGTVKSHLSHVYRKTGVSNCDELLLLCDSYPARP